MHRVCDNAVPACSERIYEHYHVSNARYQEQYEKDDTSLDPSEPPCGELLIRRKDVAEDERSFYHYVYGILQSCYVSLQCR